MTDWRLWRLIPRPERSLILTLLWEASTVCVFLVGSSLSTCIGPGISLKRVTLGSSLKWVFSVPSSTHIFVRRSICLSNTDNASADLSGTAIRRILRLPGSVQTYTCSLLCIRPTPHFLFPTTNIPSPSTIFPRPPILTTVKSSHQATTSRINCMRAYTSEVGRP